MVSKHIMQIIQFSRALFSFGVSCNYNFPTESDELVFNGPNVVVDHVLIGPKICAYNYDRL